MAAEVPALGIVAAVVIASLDSARTGSPTPSWPAGWLAGWLAVGLVYYRLRTRRAAS